MKKKIIAFDFDGVIVDSTRIKSHIFLDLFRESPGFSAVVQYEKENHSLPRRKKIEDVLRLLPQDFSTGQVEKLVLEYGQRLQQPLAAAPLVKGLLEFLGELSRNNLKLFIVSSAPVAEIEVFLKRNHLEDFFEKIFDAATPKPQALREILTRQGIAKEEILFIGDSLSDYQAALETPCPFVAVNPFSEFPAPVSHFTDFSSFDRKFLR